MSNRTKTSNLFLISACVFLISIFLGYLTYVMISGAPILRRNYELLPAGNIVEPASNEVQAVVNVEPIVIDEPPISYYIVRENDGRIGIFHRENGETHFMYNINTPITLLPEADRELLNQGVVLYTEEELTKFIEDFSS